MRAARAVPLAVRFAPALVALVQLRAAPAAPVGQDAGVDDLVSEFTALQRARAAEAFQELFGDGLGFDGEAPPPPRETFIENYVTEALNEETRRILMAKGYPAELAPASGRAPTTSFLDVEKKDSPVTLQGEVERLAVQKRQKLAVRKRVRTGKTLEVLEPSPEAANPDLHSYWEVPCGEALYKEHVYDAIPGCSPGPSAGPPCGRLVIDNLATEAEQAEMVAMMDRSFEGLFHQGEETLLVPETSSRERMGDAGFRLTVELLERARVAVARRLNISDTYYSGSLLKRMDHPPLMDDMQIDPAHSSTNPHVDKANIASYDWSCLLYFSSVGRDHGGGELVFHDPDADRMVHPLAGRLVAFSSGLENLHRVAPMHWGRRYVLSMWFTCSERHAHPELGSTGAGGGADAGSGGAPRDPADL